MAGKTDLVSVRIDEAVKQQASEVLAECGLTVSDAVRIVLTRIAKEKEIPSFLLASPEDYDQWFRAKVQEALDDPREDIPHEEVMRSVRERIKSRE
ncbi:type II toxin-antitoxin system RelB/DinJ family antitoxin [Agrobacterium rubi]|nr:type II toxin-antitoxin system RelB/DinJ family antitoxin [Agrobacterium rubi]NTF25151.1 type II toxin-antitoxin system RelB/DinJ family antitoxin [Agrobacterium rubi]